MYNTTVNSYFPDSVLFWQSQNKVCCAFLAIAWSLGSVHMGVYVFVGKLRGCWSYWVTVSCFREKKMKMVTHGFK